MEYFKLFIGMVCKKFQDTQRKEYFLFRNKFPVLQFCHEWRVTSPPSRCAPTALKGGNVERLKSESLKGGEAAVACSG